MDTEILSQLQQESLLALIGFETNSFSLLWRGSLDGFETSKFHAACDGKANTLTVIKTTTDCIFGGYTSVPWSSDLSYKSDSTAFLFSLENPRNLPSKLKSSNENAVFHSPSMGPTFGGRNTFGGHDLYVANLSNTNKNSFNSPYPYSYLNGQTDVQFFLGDSFTFQTVEVEVFQIA